jgi:thymidine phosphorylase
LEARDVLAVLRQQAGAPPDLRERALSLAGAVLELVPGMASGEGLQRAQELLQSGAAWRKFLAICHAQGGFREPLRARHRHVIEASRAGDVRAIDNRQLARVAKLAGAPAAAVAGVDCRLRVGQRVERGSPLFEVHAGSPGALTYALDHARAHSDLIMLEPLP